MAFLVNLWMRALLQKADSTGGRLWPFKEDTADKLSKQSNSCFHSLCSQPVLLLPPRSSVLTLILSPCYDFSKLCLHLFMCVWYYSIKHRKMFLDQDFLPFPSSHTPFPFYLTPLFLVKLSVEQNSMRFCDHFEREQILKLLQLTQGLLLVYQDNTLFLHIATCCYFNYSGILVFINRKGVMGDVMVAGSLATVIMKWMSLKFSE